MGGGEKSLANTQENMTVDVSPVILQILFVMILFFFEEEEKGLYYFFSQLESDQRQDQNRTTGRETVHDEHRLHRAVSAAVALAASRLLGFGRLCF